MKLLLVLISALSLFPQSSIALQEARSQKVGVTEILLLESERFYNSIYTIRTEKNYVVLDKGNLAVHLFKLDGSYEKSFGRGGQGPSEFSYPEKIEFHSSSRQFVVHDFEKVIFFKENGEFVREIKERGKAVLLGKSIVLWRDDCVVKYSLNGELLSSTEKQKKVVENARGMVAHFISDWHSPKYPIEVNGNIMYSRSGKYTLVLADNSFSPQKILTRNFPRVKMDFQKDFGYTKGRKYPAGFMDFIRAVKETTNGYNSDIV